MQGDHAILKDDDFWLRLEFAASGWFRQHSDPEMRKHSVDGFVLGFANRKKHHVEVDGYVWLKGEIGERWRFLAIIPNLVANRASAESNIAEIEIHHAQRSVTFQIANE